MHNRKCVMKVGSDGFVDEQCSVWCLGGLVCLPAGGVWRRECPSEVMCCCLKRGAGHFPSFPEIEKKVISGHLVIWVENVAGR